MKMEQEIAKSGLFANLPFRTAPTVEPLQSAVSWAAPPSQMGPVEVLRTQELVVENLDMDVAAAYAGQRLPLAEAQQQQQQQQQL